MFPIAFDRASFRQELVGECRREIDRDGARRLQVGERRARLLLGDVAGRRPDLAHGLVGLLVRFRRHGRDIPSPSAPCRAWDRS